MATQRDPWNDRVIEDSEVPPEVPAQLAMNLELLDAADAFHEALPEEFKARVAAMTDKQVHEQYVASLAGLPPETRERIRRCNVWLLAFVEEVSPPQDEQQRPGGPARRSPRAASLRLLSCPGYAATA